jgi:exodeoxyribonuclease V alpha subunit
MDGTAAVGTAPPAAEVLSGVVERVTFHNPDTGFCVLRVKARGHKDLVTVVGHAAAVTAGEFVSASGAWVNDRTHGLQLRASFLKATAPTTLEGIERYLSSGMIRGIGPVYARKLVRAFGAAVFDLIEREPDRLRKVAGIGPKRAARTVAGWAKQKAVREIVLFLHAHGLDTSRAVRIYRTYGSEAVRLVSEDPYRLVRDVRGIGFRTADQITARLGIARTAMIRVRAGISYALAAAMDEGHCALPDKALVTLARDLLEVPEALVRTTLGLELEAGGMVADLLAGGRCVFLAGLHCAERGRGLLLRRRRRPGGRGGQAVGRGARAHPRTLRPRPGPGRPGAVPDEPRRARSAFAQRRAAEGAEPAGRGAGRALRLGFGPGVTSPVGRIRLPLAC